jgi:hypothetical protein
MGRRRNMYMLNQNGMVPFAWRGLIDGCDDEAGLLIAKVYEGNSGQRDGYHR